MEETKEAHLRRTEREGGRAGEKEKRKVPKNKNNKVTLEFRGREGEGGREAERGWERYPGGAKGAGCRKSDATSRSAVSSVMSSLKS